MIRKLKTGFETSLKAYALAVIALTFSFDAAAQDPVQINPMLGSGYLRDIEFLNENHGFIIGNDQAFKTIDGGLDWTVVDFLGSGNKLESKGDFIGMITGSSMMLSTDGGDFWNVVLNVQGSLNDLHIDDNNTVYVLADDQIYVSFDQGLNWIQVEPPQNFFGWYEIYFIDSQIGFIVNYDGEIFRTEDGGTSWFMVYGDNWSSEFLQDIVFTTDQKGIAVGSWGHILRTTDQGITWTEHSIPGSDDLYSVDFFDENHLVAVGEDGRVAASSDGGESWSHSIITGFGMDIEGVSVRNSQEAYAVGAGNRLFFTSDRGMSWEEITCETGSIRDIDISGDRIHFISSDDIGSLNLEGTDCEVNDIENSWNTDVRELEMIDSELGYRIADSRDLRRTENGGENWFLTYYKESGNCTEAEDLAFENGILYLSADCSPGFFVSIDSGYNWAPAEEDMEKGKIHVVNNDLIFLYAQVPFSNSTGIFKSTDGGFNWEELVVMDGSVQSLFFVNEQVGYCGIESSLFKTTDGGETWELMAQSGSSLPWISDIFFIDENNGWIVGGDHFNFTNDGGFSWEIMQAGNSALRSLEYYDGYLYAGGNNEHIFKLDISSYVLNAEDIDSGFNEQINVYPNPNSGLFTISLPSGTKAEEYRLHSTDGRLILKTEMKKACNSCKLELPDGITAGVYILRVASEGQFFTRRIIVNP